MFYQKQYYAFVMLVMLLLVMLFEEYGTKAFQQNSPISHICPSVIIFQQSDPLKVLLALNGIWGQLGCDIEIINHATDGENVVL